MHRVLRTVLAVFLAGATTGVASAQTLGFFELEPNDTCPSGTAFSTTSGLGGGQLASSADLDFFRFTTTVPTAFMVQVAPQNTAYDGSVLKAWIRRSDGTVLAGRRLGSDYSPRMLLAVLPAGAHCVLFERLPGYSVMTKEYRLQAYADGSASAIASTEQEPNNNAGQATSLPGSGPALAAQLHSETDLDYLSIAASAGSDVAVLVDVEDRGYDGSTLLAHLVDSNGAILSGREINSDQSTGRLLLARRPTGGPVYLVLRRRDGYIVMEKYALVSADLAPSTGLVETEPNNTQGADLVQGPGQLWGQLSSREDVDGFAVTLVPGVAQLTIAPENNSYDGGVIVLDIRGPGGALLTSREVLSDGGAQIINVGVAVEGQHFLTLRAKDGYMHFDKHYILSIPAGVAVFANGFEG